MATTTILGLEIPDVDADLDAWGDIANAYYNSLEAALVAAQRGYLAGLTLSAAGSTATFGIAVGRAVDSTAARFLALTSAYTKTTSAWAVGTGNGSLDTGAIANSTWYHVWLIKRSDTGVVDVLTSLSATAPTMPTNYDYKRRIGSMLTNGSAQWVKFSQVGDEFLWDAQPTDVSVTNLGTTATLYAISTPLGVKTVAKVNGVFGVAAGTTYLSVNSPDQAALVPASTSGNAFYSAAAGNTGTFQVFVRTNTSSQIRGVSNSASTSLYVSTIGWLDRRGRDD